MQMLLVLPKMIEFIPFYPFTTVPDVSLLFFKIKWQTLTLYPLVIVSSSVTLFAGGTIILGRKFSARRFWNDCVDYKVTVFTVSFYISVAGKEMTKIWVFSILVNSVDTCWVNLIILKKETIRLDWFMVMVWDLMFGRDSETGKIG